MYFLNLDVQNFRIIKKLKIDLKPNVNIFIGKNGQGKTSLLEAIYFLIRGESFRHAQNSTLIFNRSNEKAERSLLKAVVHNKNFEHQITAHIENKKSKIYVNSKPTTGKQLLRYFSCVLFSPESLSSIKSGPEERRDLLDEVLLNVDPRHSEVILEFQKVLRSRNKILKSLLDPHSSPENHRLLEAINPLFLEKALELTLARKSALKDIQPLVNKIMKEITGGTEETKIQYLVSGESTNDWNREQVYNALHNRMQDLRSAELSLGSSLVGPHKHDVRILWNDYDSRTYCSQGQQRALILALKISQIVHHFETYGTFPILLLDDVFSEIDAQKRSFLVNFLKSIKTQVIITSTDISDIDFSGTDHSVFEVSNGEVNLLSAI